jgi:hypothetical protein
MLPGFIFEYLIGGSGHLSISTTFFREVGKLLGTNDLENPIEPVPTAPVDR